jgi:hypothetical protein
MHKENENNIDLDYNDGLLYGIRCCNAEFKCILADIYKEFNNLI